jgi:hypothetical protein
MTVSVGLSEKRVKTHPRYTAINCFKATNTADDLTRISLICVIFSQSYSRQEALRITCLHTTCNSMVIVLLPPFPPTGARAAIQHSCRPLLAVYFNNQPTPNRLITFKPPQITRLSIVPRWSRKTCISYDLVPALHRMI